MKEKIYLLLLVVVVGTYASSDRVRLEDVKVLTLYHGRQTTGRRSSPVPQLNCVGGSAKGEFTPQVVQCTNKGFDGQDYQWKCQTDMDNLYRFGKVQVTCEGYAYPEDEYILKGSCGLEYTIDYTKEGYEKRNSHHSYYGNSGNSYDSSYYPNKKKGTTLGDIVMLLIIAVVIYAVYRIFLAPGGVSGNQGSDDGGNWGNHRMGGSRPPPGPGFRDDYTQGGCSSTYDGSHTTHGGASQPQGGGFWTGAATGGILGYLFGSSGRSSYYNHDPYGRTRWRSGWGSSGGSWGSSSSSWGGSRSSPSSSSGTRTASGFGGTSRR